MILLAVLGQAIFADGNPSQQKWAETPAGISPVSMARAGEIIALDEGGIQFETPTGWQVERRDDGDVFVTTTDSGLIVIFGIVEEDDIDTRVDQLKAGMTDRVKNFKSDGEPREVTLNGLKTIGESGSGEIEGEQVQWSIDVIMARKPVLVYSFAATSVWHQHTSEYQALIKSIKRIN